MKKLVHFRSIFFFFFGYGSLILLQMFIDIFLLKYKTSLGHRLQNPQYKMRMRQVFDESHEECFVSSDETKKPFISINQGHFTTTMKASKRHYGLFFKNTDFFLT